ncbi:hypothetical protein QBC32DRAFT_332281 [Pseudoneurospora amorphoporcata]|uniref:Uncharacterized protein n=1 Tax=Pseudoneurospora amorphoporcata TaxID=241081 RepID=A0AAN6SIX4_9PEZI|nr:hypothetical protein QBC32DRAFT_332281 [Pseudoneurospora amorphoporcata]
MSLAKLPRLKELDVTVGAEFASVGLLKFIMRMETDSSGQRGGFSLSIAKQGVELNEAHEVHSRDEIKRAFNGTFHIEYIDSDREPYWNSCSM